MQYHISNTSIIAIRYGEELTISKAPEPFVVESSEQKPDEACRDEPTTLHEPDYLPSTSVEPHLMPQMELNDLIKILDLSKNKALVLDLRVHQLF